MRRSTVVTKEANSGFGAGKSVPTTAANPSATIRPCGGLYLGTVYGMRTLWPPWPSMATLDSSNGSSRLYFYNSAIMLHLFGWPFYSAHSIFPFHGSFGSREFPGFAKFSRRAFIYNSWQQLRVLVPGRGVGTGRGRSPRAIGHDKSARLDLYALVCFIHLYVEGVTIIVNEGTLSQV